MDDKLTTKDAITVLQNLQDWLYFSAMNGGTSIQREAIDMAIRALKSQPSEPHWIQCSERMPEEHEWLGTKRFGTTISDEVYVTFENPNGERFCKLLSFQNGKVNGYDQRFIDEIYKGSRPIAWTPQLEPWKGEVTE